MLAKVHTAAVIGLESSMVEVEVDTSRGLPSFGFLGLPDAAFQESRERVQAAVKNGGLSSPRQRVTVNLAPADLRKEGPAYDLPIALGPLVRQAMTQLQLTARAFHRVLKLARTISDLAGAPDIGPRHVAEALQYRPRIWS
ncbi:MAG: hypothetical protein BMS9Abin28_1872 [Anaerolineae bacterium]|nr:MAG: hypothetical protein BMS9Abin28_1872 [Anaerolineae bacterium]